MSKIKASPYKWLVLEKPVYPFSTASDADLAKMLDAYYNGDITIDDIKTKNSVGDTRSVSLSAMSDTVVGESHRAQTVQFVIGDFEHDVLTTPVNGKTRACMTLLQKDCLTDGLNAGTNDIERGYINKTQTNVGGWTSCARRTWCNSVYYNALPYSIKTLVKTVSKLTSAGNNSSNIITTDDNVFLVSSIELCGSAVNSFPGEGTQYIYYKNATTNRYKLPLLSTTSKTAQYHLRSPYTDSERFAYMDDDGNIHAHYANSIRSFAPCLCI